MIEFNDKFKLALDKLENASNHLFITGEAGTGKSTLLEYFCENSKKNMVVLAPTGVAALNVKGQTIHSFFNFYIDVTVDKIKSKKIKPRSKKLYQKLETIIIDEISMVRADLLDCIDAFLRLYGPVQDTPFGGVQMVFVGDLYQLPPVVMSQERELFSQFYRTAYFFSAHVMQEISTETIQLSKIYRQKDDKFIELLNKIRNNTVNFSDLQLINTRFKESFVPPNEHFYIYLTTTNKKADDVNQANLDKLGGTHFTFEAKIEGDFSKEYYPTATTLQFKVGAQIMMLNNDPMRRWVNGSIGTINGVKQSEEGEEFLIIKLQDSDKLVKVSPHTWQVFKFILKDEKIISEQVGTFIQYPFRLAWAVTIHKSQGKTFDRVIIDLSQGTFAAGQAYVAFSRCTSLHGIVLAAPLKKHHIRAARFN